MKRVIKIMVCILLAISSICCYGCTRVCEHTYISIVTKQATCGEDGEIIYKCSMCGDLYTERISKTNDHKGCYNCEKCNYSFIDEFRSYVDANKEESGYVRLEGGYDSDRTLVYITSNDNFSMYMSLVWPDVLLGPQSLTLGFKEHYPMEDSEWIYSFCVNDKVLMSGKFHTLKSGYYLPYTSYTGNSSGLSTVRSNVLSMLNELTGILEESLKGNGFNLCIQQIGFYV